MILSSIKKLITAQDKSWRESVSLSQLLTWTSVTAIVSASLIAGYYALNVLYQNKLSDTWAIMFLELEHEGTTLSKRLVHASKGLTQAAGADDVVFDVDASNQLKPLRGDIVGVSKLADLRLADTSSLSELPPITVLGTSGQAFLASYDMQHKQLVVRKVPSREFALNPPRPANQGSLFLITREGRLLYTNNPAINELNLTDRALVQKFIKAPIKQGQLAYTDSDGADLYGFFAEVPDSNLIMFSEVTKAAAMAPIRQIVIRFFGVLIGIVVGVILLLQLPLSKITAPVKELAAIAKMVGSGQFNVEPRLPAFGELSLLSDAFGSMARGLDERDRRVAALMREQAEKMRLAGEMAIARRIQENLLPSGGLPIDAGLSLAAVYISANECAGDWYQYFHNSENGETVFAIADVSGHGAGSSVFTAVIAGLFDQARHRREPRFPLEEFMRQTNAAIYRLGKQQWHATMFIARYVAGSGVLEFINAGHPAPFIKRGDLVETLMSGSETVLGLDVNASYPCHKVKFSHHDALFLYTDGLIEAARADGKMFGRKRARELLKGADHSPNAALTAAMDDWKTYLSGAAPQDDVCVLFVRAA